MVGINVMLIIIFNCALYKCIVIVIIGIIITQ